MKCDTATPLHASKLRCLVNKASEWGPAAPVYAVGDHVVDGEVRCRGDVAICECLKDDCCVSAGECCAANILSDVHTGKAQLGCCAQGIDWELLLSIPVCSMWEELLCSKVPCYPLKLPLQVTGMAF